MKTAEASFNQDLASVEIHGPLNVDTAVPLRESSAKLLKTAPSSVSFNLQAVTECDSAALALLTAWARDAKRLGKEIHFTHVPPQLMAIAQLSGLEKILPLSG